MQDIIIADRMKLIKKSKLRQIFDQAPKNAINLGLGEIQFPTPSPLTAYAKKVLDEEDLTYTPNAGLPELKGRIAAYYNNYIKPDNVCVTNGSQEAIFAYIMSVVNPGDNVFIANPGFLAYETILKIFSAETKFFHLCPDDFSLDFEDFEQKVNKKTKLIILNNPSNPIGKIFTKEEVDFILTLSKKYNIQIIVDEIYRELYFKERIESMLYLSENITVVSGMSKSHCMTGWRLGWIASANAKIIQSVVAAHQYISTCASYLSQKVACFALSAEGFRINKTIRKKLKLNRELAVNYIKNNFPEIFVYPAEVGPYLFLKVDTDDMKLALELTGNGIIVMPGSIFGSNATNWIRMNYGLPKKTLIKGLEKINKLEKI